MKIVVFDDEQPKRARWCESLEKLDVGEIQVMNDDFQDEVEKLEERRKKLRRESSSPESLEDLEIPCAFDEVDVLIIDYDLLGAVDLTGEEIAYLLRCFSTCGVIVALNQFRVIHQGFDLTMQGHLESFADLNIAEDFLSYHGLWRESGWEEFRPWHWPLLPDLVTKYEKRLAQAEEWMKRPILESLGLDQASAGILPRKILEFIQTPRKEPEETTFEDFVTTSENGLRNRDAENAIEELKPRIAAARLHRWLEALVLGGQEILVDAPHLVSRFPSLLGGPVDDLEAWDSVATIRDVVGIEQEIVREFRYRHEDWLSRPAWYWTKVREHEAIREVADPWHVEEHNWIFCEDTARFAKSSEVKSFVADLPSKFNRRYVRRLDDIDYHPRVRFSL